MWQIRVGKWFALGLVVATAGATQADGGLMFFGAALLIVGVLATLAEARLSLT